MFDAATVVVGLHGGSFSNICFCRPGTVIVEINREHHIQDTRHCFGHMALQRGLEYRNFSIVGNQFSYDEMSLVLSDADVTRLVSVLDEALGVTDIVPH